jgi:hypothetical protein
MDRKEIGAAAVIFFVSLLLYLPVLNDGFISDDFYFINQTDPGFAFESLTTFGFFRPLVRLSFVLDALFWGDAPAGYHLTNILLHFLTGLTVYYFSRLLGMGAALSLLSALFFTAHPVNVESVAWLSGRSEILAAGFFFLALIFFRLSGTHQRKGLYAAGALISLFLGLCAKESVVMAAPAALALCFIDPPAERRLRDRAGLLAGFWILAAAFVLFRYLLFSNTAFWEKIQSPAFLEKLPALIRLFFGHSAAAIVILPVTALLLLILFARRLRLFLVLFVLFLLPLIPHLVYGFSRARYLYLPAAFLSVLLGAGIAEMTGFSLKKLSPAPFILAAVLLISFMAATALQLPRWEAAGNQYRVMAAGLAEAAKGTRGGTVYYFGTPRMLGDTGLLFIGLDRAAAFYAGGPPPVFRPLGPGEIRNICAGSHDGRAVGGVFQWRQGAFTKREDLVPLILEMREKPERDAPLPCLSVDSGQPPAEWTIPAQNRVIYRGSPFNPFLAALLDIEYRALKAGKAPDGEITWRGEDGRTGGRIPFDLPGEGDAPRCQVALFRHPDWVAAGRIARVEIRCHGPVRLKKVCFASILQSAGDPDRKPGETKRKKGW